MANLDIRSSTGIIDKRSGRGVTGVAILAEVANTTSTSVLRTRLTAISATKYSTARLNAMTKNDMLFALRVETADSAGIK